jgi:hypothetical protein
MNAQFLSSLNFTNGSVAKLNTLTPQVFVRGIYTTPHNANLPPGIAKIIF